MSTRADKHQCDLIILPAQPGYLFACQFLLLIYLSPLFPTFDTDCSLYALFIVHHPR
jgi:hypothetical protein